MPREPKISQLLIDVKLAKNKTKRSRMDPKDYGDFCDKISAFYDWIDRQSIEDLETVKIKQKKAGSG